jgi:hypothetical protein
MPLPVLAGVPALISFITGALGGLAAWFAKQGSRRLLIMGVYVVAATALSVTFYNFIVATTDAINAALPSDFVQFLAMVMPSNVGACVSAIVASDIAHYVYRWNLHFLSKKFN